MRFKKCNRTFGGKTFYLDEYIYRVV